MSLNLLCPSTSPSSLLHQKAASPPGLALTAKLCDLFAEGLVGGISPLPGLGGSAVWRQQSQTGGTQKTRRVQRLAQMLSALEQRR